MFAQLSEPPGSWVRTGSPGVGFRSCAHGIDRQIRELIKVARVGTESHEKLLRVWSCRQETARPGPQRFDHREDITVTSPGCFFHREHQGAARPNGNGVTKAVLAHDNLRAKQVEIVFAGGLSQASGDEEGEEIPVVMVRVHGIAWRVIGQAERESGRYLLSLVENPTRVSQHLAPRPLIRLQPRGF